MKNYEIEVDGQLYHVKVRELPDDASMEPSRSVKNISSGTEQPVEKPASAHTETDNGTQVVAPMSGTILKILVRPEQQVKAGETLLILEAMKMENEIVAPIDGIIKTILVKPNENVDSEQVLIVF